MLSFWLGLRFLLNTQDPAFVVSSGSMIPALNVGDIIIIRDGGTFGTLVNGDIIVFNSPYSNNRVIVHRIYSISETNNLVTIITKGDNNPSPDGWLVTEEHYLGKVILTIPKIGLLSSIISPPINYLIMGLLLLLIFISELKRIEKKPKKEEESIKSDTL